MTIAGARATLREQVALRLARRTPRKVPVEVSQCGLRGRKPCFGQGSASGSGTWRAWAYLGYNREIPPGDTWEGPSFYSGPAEPGTEQRGHVWHRMEEHLACRDSGPPQVRKERAPSGRAGRGSESQVTAAGAKPAVLDFSAPPTALRGWVTPCCPCRRQTSRGHQRSHGILSDGALSRTYPHPRCRLHSVLPASRPSVS